MRSNILRITVAGTVTWIAAVFAYNAIFHWAEWPWAWASEHTITVMSLAPPAVLLVGYFMFRWAVGEQVLIGWLQNSKPRLTTVVLAALLAFSAFQSRSAAENAAEAVSAAFQAESSASESRDAAHGAQTAAEDAQQSCVRY
jgi:ABC-type Fe3+ transport system permease subunit